MRDFHFTLYEPRRELRRGRGYTSAEGGVVGEEGKKKEAKVYTPARIYIYLYMYTLAGERAI